MGIRLASVRHTDVVVMAPALTETAQTKSFSFVTSPSRSPSLSLKNHTKKTSQVLREALQPKFSNGHNSPTGMNGHSPINKTTYSINGLAKSLKNEFLPLNKKNEETDNKDTTDNSYSITPIGGYMMNSSYMGDPEMGLQKSSKEICEGDKISPDDEQIFKHFGNVLNNEETPNVEDLMKVIQSNLDVTTNEIESGPSGDIDTIFGNGLFNDADIMNMCVDETLVGVNKDTFIRDKIEDIRKKQFQLFKKIEFLLRRLKKNDARTIGIYAAEEITGAIEYSSNLLDASSRFRGISDGSDNLEVKCDVKPVSFFNMSHFMRQMEHAVTQQTNTVNRNNNIRNCKYFGSGSSTNTLISTSNGVRSSLPGSVLPPFPGKVKSDLEASAGELKTQIIKIQQDIDSDVTDSSSGCESCDEFVNYNNTHQHPLSIGRRAGWRWAEERSLIAAKWTWLQSQIADLEYRIRQHNDVKKNMRMAKGALKFVKEEGSLPNGCSSSDKGGEGSCSRTRGLVKSSFLKRKVLQLAGIHRTSKKASKSSNLRCSCRVNLPGCGVCTGRAEPGQPSEPLSTLPINHRVAYIDPGFHPYISFPSDVSSSVHYSAVMKCTDWQTRASRIQGKSSLSSTEDKNRVRGASGIDHQIVDLQRSKAAALAVSVNKYQKLRRKLGRGKRRRRSALLGLDNRYRHRRKHSVGLSGADSEETVDQDIEPSGGSRYPSPVPSPASAHAAPVSKDKETSVKRKRENSYDIDNIVIPYSIAAATRPEKLLYKEILTPKWRHIYSKPANNVEQLNGVVRRSSHENPDADEGSNDELYQSRHDRCLIDERKKFASYIKLGHRGGRAQRRTDSRADSSGPNTPDGMSPRDDGVNEEPPAITSPPLSLPPCDNDTGVRKRTTSNSQTILFIQEAIPYEPRIFPLSDDTYKEMLSANENQDQLYPPTMKSFEEIPDAPVSPGSVSTDSADSFLGEDPNDPEWNSTVERSNSKR